MPSRLLVVSIVLSAGAASSVRAQSNASPNDFVPKAQYADTVAKCETSSAIGPVREGEHGYLLRFGTVDSLSRVVMATWDSTGHLRTYSDARGDLRGPPIPLNKRGMKTSIVIDFEKQMGLMLNFADGRDRGLMISIDDALHAKAFGPPEAVLDRMHRQCGAPAYRRGPDTK